MADDELYEDSEEPSIESPELEELLSKRAQRKAVNLSARRSIDDYFESRRLRRELDDELMGHDEDEPGEKPGA